MYREKGYGKSGLLHSQCERWLQKREKELPKQRHLKVTHPEDEATVSLIQDWSICDLN